MKNRWVILRFTQSPRLRAHFDFVFEEPSGELILKLNQDANATAIRHFEIPDDAGLPELGYDGLGNLIAQSTHSYLLSNFHRSTKTDTKN
jgi:hypothetical protein